MDKQTKVLVPLPADRLRLKCDPESLGFKTTSDLEPLEQALGQQRAVDALHFGVGIAHDGYNLFVLGRAGAGKYSVVRKALDDEAAAEPVPEDWCYINNFSDPQKPIALRMPVGHAREFKEHMDELVKTLRTEIPAAFESEAYRSRVNEIEEQSKRLEDEAFAEIQRDAEKEGMVVLHTPHGFGIAPVEDGHVIGPEEFAGLPEDKKKRIEATIEKLKERLSKVLMRAPDRVKTHRKKIEGLNREIAMSALHGPIDELCQHYAESEAIQEFLAAIQNDVLEHLVEFTEQPSQPNPLGLLPPPSQFFQRYTVNVMVDNADKEGAPVVFEDHPTLQNLLGRVEYTAHMGALVTDFTQIRGGALHRANGGYLIIEIRKLLFEPYAWLALKRALSSGKLKVESLGQMLGLISTASLEPEPVPLKVKVVLLGERLLYYLLCEFDPDFNDLFKVAAEFEDEIGRDPESAAHYARLISSLVAKYELRPFEQGAVARVIDEAARLAGDTKKLSLHMRDLVDLLTEANYWAKDAHEEQVTAGHVQKAIENRIHRQDRIRERIYEAIHRGTLLIDTDGMRVGQINGLSVLQAGDFAFGQPSRITATVRIGKGEVIDIQREVELGGAIHSKGVMILAAFLGARYAREQPLTLSASLVFEQTYGTVEGDSASVAELCALVSALSELPLKQSIAVTGSVNQQGQVQAIGGVNEKIEGFFDVCKTRGLTGDQGVLIPASNVDHLMLREDVVEAAAQGQFQVWAVEDIDQVMESLTGFSAGVADERGQFAEDSINGRVMAGLKRFIDIQLSYEALSKEHERDG